MDSDSHGRDLLRGRVVIGIAERIDLPEWGVSMLRAKIDTGARSSALHVDDVEILEGDRARFSVVLHRKHADRRVVVEAPIVRRSRVRSSSGRAEERIFVATKMKLGPVEKTIEISLASREPMIFRMLLGRSALHHDFLVDPSHRYLQSPTVKKSPRKKASSGAKPKAKPAPKKPAARSETSVRGASTKAGAKGGAKKRGATR